MNQPTLFPLASLPPKPTRKQRRLAITAFKQLHGLATHDNKAPNDPARWVCVKVPTKRLDNGESLAGMPLAEMFAYFGRLLEEGGYTGYGNTEADAIKDLANVRHIECKL